MKMLMFAVAVMLAFVPVGVTAQEASEAPGAQSLEAKPRVAVVFERSVKNREVLAKALQESLRDAGYQPVWSGRSALRSEKDWKRLPEGTQKVLIVSDARVATRQNDRTSPSISIGKGGNSGRIGADVRWQKTTAFLDAKMVNVADRALIGFGHGAGEASNLERIQVSTASVIKIAKTGGLWRQQSKEDMVYKAAKQAAAEAIKSLR